MRQSTKATPALTHSIIGAFYEVYNTLGLVFEHVYTMALERELTARGHCVAREVSVRIFYKGEELTTQRLDMIVDDAVVVEMKAGKSLEPYAARQLYDYLRATSLEAGLLFHFGPEPAFFRANCRQKFKSKDEKLKLSAPLESSGT
ncbi:MAG TPA: GxxExxY protein [Gemmatimonadaceae bacterium]|jgi:GxxExxY protein|nr:GxxExxY protein [Gemmatimonadaceae bacterium]